MQKRIFSLFWHTAKRYPWRVTAALVNSTLSVIISSFIGPFIIAKILDAIQAGDVTLMGVLPSIIAYAATQLYGEVIGWRITLYCIWTFETAGQVRLYDRTFEHLSNQSLHFHNDRFGGALVSQTNKLVGAFEKFWDTIVFNIIPMATSIVLATAILAFVFWQFALVLFILCITYIVAVFSWSRHMAELNKREAQASSTLTARLADTITNIMAVKSDGNEQKEAKNYSKLATSWRERSLDNMRAFLKASSLYSFIVAVINSSALILAVVAVEHNAIQLGAIYLAITYTLTVTRQLWEMNSILRAYNRVLGDAHDMTEILDLQPSVQDKSQAPALAVPEGAIAFRAVDFRHGDDKNAQLLFNNFELTIAPGQKVGLVGHSGSGKTTLTKLLLRFMDIHAGSITIDGQSISEVQQASLRRAIAYVSQEPLLFHRTIAENISYGRQDASREEIVEAAKKAHAHEFIETLADGYDTMVGERGVKLSGGQRQRVAIARAILKDAPILVLDEATSALDSESEKAIQAALEELMQGRTTIAIAHRLSTIQHMDTIVVLDNGAIAEQGSHQKLLAKKGVYASLWAHQSGGFLEE